MMLRQAISFCPSSGKKAENCVSIVGTGRLLPVIAARRLISAPSLAFDARSFLSHTGRITLAAAEVRGDKLKSLGAVIYEFIDFTTFPSSSMITQIKACFHAFRYSR